MVADQSLCIKTITYETSKVIDDFLNLAGKSLDHFRYYTSRSKDVLNNHVVTCILYKINQPIGYGHLDNDGNAIWLGIAIADGFTGKGYGNIIMQFLITAAKEKNIKAIQLTVDFDNELAIKLYQKFGFKKIGLINEKAYLMEYQIII